MMVSGYASIHDLYDDQKSIHILVWMGTAAVIAPAIGPLLGGLLLLVTDWRGIFFSLFALGTASILALWFSMPESTQAQSQESLKIKSLLSSYGKIISNSSFMISAACFAFLYGGIIGWITSSPFILLETLQLTPTTFGYLQIPVFGGYIVGAQLVKPLLGKSGKEKLISVGLVLSLLSGIFLVIFSLLLPTSFLSFVIPLACYSVGFGFAAAPLNRVTLTSTTEKKGMAMGVFYLTMTGIGTLVSVILSISHESVFSVSVGIGASSLASFLLNKVNLRLTNGK